MRNMSFALTTAQIKAGTKTVTRRMGWTFLKPGDLISPVLKGMGLKPGERIQRLRDPIRIIDVRREPLDRMFSLPYGKYECALEGFPYLTAEEFAEMFCRSHKGCTDLSVITRIQFEYT